MHWSHIRSPRDLGPGRLILVDVVWVHLQSSRGAGQHAALGLGNQLDTVGVREFSDGSAVRSRHTRVQASRLLASLTSTALRLEKR